MGLIFKSSEQVEEVVKELVSGIFSDEKNKKSFMAKEVVVKFEVRDPDHIFFLDPSEPELISTKQGLNADLALIMGADFMHDFWLKKTNIVESIKRGDFKVEVAPDVAAAKMVDLLPVLASGLDIYPSVCKKHGITV